MTKIHLYSNTPPQANGYFIYSWLGGLNKAKISNLDSSARQVAEACQRWVLDDTHRVEWWRFASFAPSLMQSGSPRDFSMSRGGPHERKRWVLVEPLKWIERSQTRRLKKDPEDRLILGPKWVVPIDPKSMSLLSLKEMIQLLRRSVPRWPKRRWPNDPKKWPLKTQNIWPNILA